MTALKIFLCFEEGEDASQHMEVQLTVPKGWRPGPAKKLRDFAVETYDAKHADNACAGGAAAWHLEVKGEALGDADVIESVIERKDRVYLKPGASLATAAIADARAARAAAAAEAAAAEAAAAAAAKKDLLRCKNYGCGQSYKEGENHADVCVHHKSPPFFHDLKKGWSCCPGKVAYDWEEFQAIPGCVRSRHSTETPGAALGQSAEQEAKASFGGGGGDDVCPAVPAAPQPVLKKISDYNDANPDAASAAKSFGAATGAAAKPKVVRNEDGSFRCQRKGCTAKNARDDEGPRACVHHVGTPVFHETYKWWSCCPHARKYDFDEFMQVTGCRVGAHWSGEGDEPPTEPNC